MEILSSHSTKNNIANNFSNFYRRYTDSENKEKSFVSRKYVQTSVCIKCNGTLYLAQRIHHSERSSQAFHSLSNLHCLSVAIVLMQPSVMSSSINSFGFILCHEMRLNRKLWQDGRFRHAFHSMTPVTLAVVLRKVLSSGEA